MIKRLLQCVRQYKLPAILATVFVCCQVVTEVLMPKLMGRLIDYGIMKNDMDYVWSMGLLVFLCILGSVGFGVLSGIESAKACVGFGTNLRQDLFYRLQDYSFSNIDKFKTASIVTRLTTDVMNVEGACGMLINVAVRAPIMLVAALVASMMINVKIGLVIMLISPFLVIGLSFLLKRAHPVFMRMFVRIDRMNTVVQENVRGIRVVKALVRENHEVDKFTSASNSICNDSIKAERAIKMGYPLMSAFLYTAMLIISWIAAKAIVHGDMTTGQLSTVFTYIMQILSSLTMLSMIVVTVTISRASAERISEILNENPDVTNPENPVMQVKDGSIDFDDVDFSYSKEKDKCCLRHVDLHVQSGETVGIIGGTGSGKSSLVQMIPRLYDVTDGCVKVGGIDVRDYSLNVIRDNVAMVLQKNVLFSGTIKENLRWGNPNATEEEMIEACKIAQVDDFIQQLPEKYDTFIEQGGSNVSGGQKQRLCIARALLKKPKILILDDSTSAVDTDTELRIQEGLSNYIPGVTKVIISQRVSSVEHADKIIVINNGEIDAVGNHVELLIRNKIYQEVYESQMKGGNA